MLILLWASSLLLSCEDVIQIEASEVDQNWVVDGKISNLAGDTYVIIRQSGAYFGDLSDQAISQAQVQVTQRSPQGQEDIIPFESNAEGVYLPVDTAFVGLEEHQYELWVQVGGEELHALTSMPKGIDIRQLYFEYHDENSPELAEGYYLYGSLDDDPLVRNYYRVEFWQNGKPQKETAEQIFVFDDLVFDGVEDMDGMFGYWGVDDDEPFPLLTGDTLILKVGAIDAEAHAFFKALSDTPFQGGLFGRNPANVPTNIQGGEGLFYAGAFFVSEPLVVPSPESIRQ